MKARLLNKLLNTTRPIADYGDYIGIGSSLVHNLISIDKRSLKIKYVFETSPEGAELIIIWDKLHELVRTGEIKEIISGKDEIDPRLPVYTITDGKLISSFTDRYGYPNTDEEGRMQYENTHFPTAIEALEWGIENEDYSLNWKIETRDDLQAKLTAQNIKIDESVKIIKNLRNQLSELRQTRKVKQ